MTKVKIPFVIREIFPISITTASRILVLLIAFIVLCALYGCGSSRMATQTVRDVSIDTIYLSNTQYDSIYIYKDRMTDRTKDTIYLKDVSIEYRYKLLRDTVRQVERDSIPYEVTVIKTKEIARPLAWFDHLTRTTFWLLLGFLCFYLFKLIRTLIKFL